MESLNPLEYGAYVGPSAGSDVDIENDLLKCEKEELIDIISEQAKMLEALQDRLDRLVALEEGEL